MIINMTTKRKLEGGEDLEICCRIHKKVKTKEIPLTKKRKHDDDFEPSSQPTKKCKIDIILHEDISDYTKKRRDMMIYT